MAQIEPIDAYLGPSRTGQAIGATLYEINGSSVYAAFSTVGWYEAPTGSGAWHHAGLSLPDAGGVVAIGISGTEYMRAAVGPSLLASMPSAVWTHAQRTLTMLAAAVTAAMMGATLNITRSATFSAMLSGLSIPSTWSKLYFTYKSQNGLPDTVALVQLVASNPGAGGDGLLRLNGAPTTAGNGSVTVNQGAGTAHLILADDATAILNPAAGYYDVKALLADGSSVVLVQGTCNVVLTSTESIV